MSFTRSDDFMKSEKGGEWFEDLLKQLASSTNQEIVSAISGNPVETVASLTEKYREQVGLDLIANQKQEIVITAAKDNKAISKRASNKVDVKDIPEVQQAVDSFCQHSGGTKSTHSILNNLRKMLGKESISYTDKELVDYINDRKKYFYTPIKDTMSNDPGAADVDSDFNDNAADYAHRGANK